MHIHTNKAAILKTTFLEFTSYPTIFHEAGLADVHKSPEGARGLILAYVMTFVMTLLALLRDSTSRVMKKLQNGTCESNPALVKDSAKEEFRPPSPAPVFTEVDLLSSVLKKLGELEENIFVLQSKPSEMPYEKEELLNAAVRRLDALEAKLIATKKTLYESLMRQEELLACIDRQEEARLHKKRHCF